MSLIAVITGSSSGIGLECARILLSQGVTVYGLSRHETVLPGIRSICCDISDSQSVQQAFAQIAQGAGKIDLLVNNAGCGISGAVEFTEISAAQQLMNVNFFGAVRCIQQALPLLRQGHKPRIVNISSIAAPIGIPYQAFYSASKAALSSLGDSLRIELRPMGISVCTVLPGDIKTGFTSARQKNEAGRELYGDAIRRSVSKMEQDELGGMSAVFAAKKICKAALAKNPPAIVAVGWQYKAVYLLSKLLPQRLISRIVALLYT